MDNAEKYGFARATAIFVVDGCQFGSSWIFGLKMELMACAGLIGGTTEKRQLFSFVPTTKLALAISLIFSLNNSARAKLAAINNKNCCGTAEV